MIAHRAGPGRVLCALDMEQDDWGPLATASVMAEYFRVPLDAVYAAKSGEWEGRTERVKRLIAEHAARERLASLTAPLTGNVAVTSSVKRGAPAEVILGHAGESRAGLIVLGAGDRKRFGGGSQRLAATIASTANAAVLTVPSDARACAVRRVLVPITTATAVAPAMRWASALACRFGSMITLACVAPPAHWLFGPHRRAQDMARRRGSLLAESLERLKDAEIVAMAAPEQRDATELARLADPDDFDLVVLGLPAVLDAEQLALMERLRQCSLVPTLSVRARERFAAPAQQLVTRSESHGSRHSEHAA